MRARLAFAALLLALCAVHVSAQEFRNFNPILGPGLGLPLPPGAQRVAPNQMRSVDTQSLERALRQTTDAWNTPQLAAQLGPQFYDSTRLGDAMTTLVPRDARLRLVSVQGVQVLEQHVLPDPSGVFDIYVSRVSATARTQVEFNDPQRGFQRLDGTNEFILKVTQRVLR